MLKHLIFIGIFLCAFFIILTLTSEIIIIALGGYGVFDLPFGQIGRFQALIYSAITFLFFSGFLPMYILVYVCYMRNISRLHRNFINVIIYMLACIIFWFLFSSWPTNIDAILIIFGLIGILVSDALAENISKRILIIFQSNLKK